MKDQIKICLLLAPLFFSSCTAQEEKFVNLAKISTNFNVSGFYQNKVKRTNEIISIKPEKVDKKAVKKLLDNAFFVKDTLGYYKTDGRLPTDLYLESTNEWMVRDKKPVEMFGFGYKTVAYDQDKDTLAILNSVAFPKMDMVEDNKGKLMYLRVEKTSKNTAEFNKIIDYINKNCKKITVDDPDKNDSYWEDKSFYYTLSKKDNREEEILSFDAQGSKTSKFIDVTEITLAMFEKTYIKKMEDLGIYSAGIKFWKKPL